MNTQDTLKATGQLLITHYNSDGVLIDTRYIPNLVVQVGKNYIASRMIDASATVMSHMELGSGVTAPVSGNTTLQTVIAGSRQAFSSTPSVSTNTITYSATFGAGIGTGDITEAGIFNASSGGTMLCRTTFGLVTKEAGDIINISWSVTVS